MGINQRLAGWYFGLTGICNGRRSRVFWPYRVRGWNFAAPPNDISGTVKAGDVKICTRVDCIKSDLPVDKVPMKEACLGLPRDIIQMT